MDKKIVVIKGDGIGPEVVEQAINVLNTISKKYNHKFSYEEILMGGASIDKFGVPITDEAIATAKKSHAVLLGAIGGDPNHSPWYKLAPNLRPEAGLLKLRKELNLYANLRPAFLYDSLKKSCPLKDEIIKDGFDMIIVRELVGGIYFGEKETKKINDHLVATDKLVYSDHEIKRITVKAFEIAMKRKKKITSVDKANVLDSSRLWRDIVNKISKEYPKVTVEHMFVDNCAMQLIKDPAQFDVILTENMFGDILSDEASMLTGSIGMLPSASLSDGSFGMYEPCHGSAPDIAGKNIANPLATILSVAMMLRYSFDLKREALDIENAVDEVIKEGFRTEDIFSDGTKLVGTDMMGWRVSQKVE
jgi:3-isopropylmalate dehydrogenase